MGTGRRAELVTLFREFSASYLPTPEGQQTVARYAEARRRAWQNFDTITEAARRGAEVAEQVLLKLLPHPDSAANRQNGAWIHVVASTSDASEWLQRAGWTRPEDRRLVARAVLRFASACVERPDQLPAQCAELSESPYGNRFDAGLLSPLLNALRPSDFLLINAASQQVVNYFSGTSCSLALRDYPEANAAGLDLIRQMAAQARLATPADYSWEFYLFSRWLMEVQRYELAPSRFVIHPEMYNQWPPMW